MAAPRTGSTPLTGADWFFVAAERMMLTAGQGENAGLTVLRLGPDLDVAALRSAAARLAAASPIAAACLRKGILGVPRWQWRSETRISFPVEQYRGRFDELCVRRLNEPSPAAVRFDVIGDARGSTVVMRWRHLLLDGKGAELLLAEIARLAESADSPPPGPDSWGPFTPRLTGWRALLGEAARFRDHFYTLARTPIRSLGGAEPRRGTAEFFVEEFSAAETAQITARATAATHELFQMGWFLAAAMRMHHAVLRQRGEDAESYQSSCAVQERKRGARHPIWQNHISRLFFRLMPADLADLGAAARALQGQFIAQTRQRLDAAFATTSHLQRRMPARLYLRMLRRDTNGHLTSFFFSHTGEFLHECRTFCGAPIEHGWHVPSVCQPPGTGVFFSQCDARLTATISWREGALRDGELEILRARLRTDLLGPDSIGP
ncbi:MAG: hypothetical protein ACREVR_09060 [Burkholderiales bacterium]